MDPTMQSPIRRTIPFSGGEQITVPSGPHYYTVKTWIGSTSQGNTPQEAFESLSRNATPFQTGASVDGGIMNIPVLGHVRQLVDPDHQTIINTAEPDHLLYPGNVFRSIVQEGNDLYVVTHGYGTGEFPQLNEFAAPGGWKLPDFMVRAELNNKRPLGYPMDELNAIVPKETSPATSSPLKEADMPELSYPPPIFFPSY
jgi:hypothetical protein